MKNKEKGTAGVPAYEGGEAFAFFSYSHDDRESLKPCFRILAERYRFWYDEGIKSGREWVDEIGKKIFGCDVFVVFLSEHALESRFVQDEIHFAYHYAKKMLAVFLEPVTLSKSLEFMLGRFQHVLWYGMQDLREKTDKLAEGFPETVRAGSPGERQDRQAPEIRDARAENEGNPARVSEKIRERYEILRKLKEGGFGSIYLVRSRENGAEYVMKRQRPESIGEEQGKLGMALARNELHNLLVLGRKPYVPVVIDYDEAGGDYFLVMSRKPGISLKELLRRHGCRMDCTLALCMVYQAALILQDLHGMRLVHGDVKPSNIMFDSFGHLHLIDFGSAADVNDRNYLRTYTLKYAAPEQREETGKPDYRFDIYALGMLLREMTGQGGFAAEIWLPDGFSANSPVSLAEKICAKMTASQPSDRYENMGEVIAALELACPPDSAERLMRFAKNLGITDDGGTAGDETAMEDDPDRTADPFGTGGDDNCTVTDIVSLTPDFSYNDRTVFI